MKRFVHSLVVIACVILLSCSPSVPMQLASFVEETESSCSTYSSEEWETSLAQFSDLVRQFKSKKDIYTAKEKKFAIQSIDRYYALADSRITHATPSVQELLTSVSTDVLEMLTSLLESPEDWLVEIIDNVISNISDDPS